MKKITRQSTVYIFVGIVVIALMVLAISLNSMQLQPGHAVSFQELVPGVSEPGESLNFSDFFLIVFRVGMILFWISLAIYLILLFFDKEARKKFLRSLIFFIPFFIFLYFLSNQPVSQETAEDISPRLFGGSQVDLTQITPAPPAPDYTAPPSWVTTAVVIGIAVAIAAVIGGAVFVLWRRSQLQSKDTLAVVRREAQAALDDIQSGLNLRDAILRCYFQMVQTLRESRGIDREQGMTPYEFELMLQRRGLPAEPIHQLTQLFEKVRYGGEKPGPQDEQIAVNSLTAIIRACEKTRGE